MNRTYLTWLVSLLGTSIFTIVGILVNVLPFSVIRNFLNFAAPDGNLESLTVDVFAIGRSVFSIFGSLGFAILLVLVLRKKLSHIWINNWLRKIRAAWQIFQDDAASFWQSFIGFFPRSTETALLIAIVIAGAIVRGILLDRPMQHDESYTYIAFASRGLLKIISDYHLPNNHVFHTLLVYISDRMLGNAPWAVRLPAFLAGVTAIPAVYIAGRLVFNNLAGISAAALLAFNLYSIHHSTQARGYSLLALISVMLWILSIKLLHERNVFIWFLFGTFAALGFFTSPTMLYPYAAITVWLGIKRLLRRQKNKYAGQLFWLDFISSMILSGLITLLFYSLILANYGLSSLINNPIISRMRDSNYQAFFENLVTRWGKVWAAWHEGAFPSVAIIGLVMFSIALIFHGRYSNAKLPFPILGIIVVLAIMILQRTVGWVRIWGFAFPFYIVFVGGGISILTDIIKNKFGTIWKVTLPTIIVAAFAISTISLVGEGSVIWEERLGEPGEVERASQYLGQRIDNESLIFVTAPDAPAFWYYGRIMNFPSQAFDTSRTDASGIYVIQNIRSNKSIEDVLEAEGSETNRYVVNLAELVYASRKINIYSLQIR